jgi:molecular chaperone HtpG
MSEVVVEKQTRGFETEVTKLLDIMIHSLYSNKEIFLRELISNASDAADKLRFESLKHPEYYENDGELKIWLEADESNKTLTIRDNGIGMSAEEAIQNLGTIAKSGTKAFFEQLTGDQAKDTHLIGQFGVGFYACFMVADRVTVKSRRAGLTADQAVQWESEGKGQYTVETTHKASRGTEIILHMKDSETEFLSDYRLRHIIQTYSNHINIPIVMKKEATVEPTKEETADQKTPDVVPTEEVVNQAKALWTLNKNDITDEEYKEFYKHISHDFSDPLAWVHNKVEGTQEYTSLLYVPSMAPFDLWDPNRTRGLKLYIKRVFIMEDAEQLLPNYLRFIRGVIDSSDLPLNVSRELLQRSKVIDTIRSGTIKRIFSMLEQLAEQESEKYQKFWDNFGRVLKEGPAEDYANRERIAKLLRFSSTQNTNETQSVSLTDYVGRMKEGQKKIYYLAADSYIAAKNSPHLEMFREKNVEVLLLTDKVDEWLMAHLTEFDGKPFQSVAKGVFGEDDLGQTVTEEDKQAREIQNKEFEEVINQVKTLLKDKVKDVRLTQRLKSSPACIVADEHDMTAQMERILKAAGQTVDSKPILELNPNHLLIKRLQQEKDTERFSDWSHILLDQAILSEGGQLQDPATFVKRFNEMLLAVAH